ncbi:MAG TPA: hypothetical protein VJM76_02085 [Gammaproteobacteria bacterium]|nr:hypothetical protein [Gammaproteobacteria bacterium]
MKSLTIIALLFFLSATLAVAYAEDNAPPQLKLQADSLAALLKDSYAEEYGRKYYVFTQGSGTRVAAVFYGFEGYGLGNNWSQYLAVFSVLSGAEPGQLKTDYFSLLDVVKIGAKGWRAADFEKVKITHNSKPFETIIVISIKEVISGDPPNFPSKQSQAQYRIQPFQGERLRVEN